MITTVPLTMIQRGCSAVPFLLLLFLQTLLLNVVTLPHLSAFGLEVTSPDVTSELISDGPYLSSPKTPSHLNFVTSSPSLRQAGNVIQVTPPSLSSSSSSSSSKIEGNGQLTQDAHPESFLARSSSLLSTRENDRSLEETDETVANCTYYQLDGKEKKTRTGGLPGEGHNDVIAIEDRPKRTNESFFNPENDDVTEDDSDSTFSPKHSRVRRQTVTLHGPLWTDKNTLFVELVVVGDYHFSIKHGANAIDRIMKIVGVTNALYIPLGIVVVLVDVELWTQRNQVEVYSVKEKTLGSMKQYRKTMLKDNPNKPNDNVVLITTQLSLGAGGVASTGGMCSDDRSVSIVQDVNEDVGVVGLFLAHEMGHNLNMKHDGNDRYFPGYGTCKDSGKIMVPTLSAQVFDPNIGWSGCSRLYLEERKKTADFDCLKNVPTETYPRSSCGNGIVEYGEECDCGPPKMCKNSCCNPATCRLAPRARCASGACCNTDTCQPHTSGRECRKALDDCDLPEYCSGDSESCPADVHKGDGSYCGYYNQGHCYKGQCGNQGERCRKLWGHEAISADAACSRNLSGLNDRVGNCGQDPVTSQYVHCDQQSSQCGTLYCNARSSGELKLSQRTNHFEGKKYVGSSICQYIVGYITHYPMADWLSPDGVSCGDRKMCINQKCNPIPGTDDALNCPRKCSGNGVCNSRGNCHCNPGYDPPDCSKPGSGGSYDSGSSGDSSGGGMIALWVILIIIVLLVLVLVILGCTWDRTRKWWEDNGRVRVSAVAPKAAMFVDDCCCRAFSKVILWMVSSGPLGKIVSSSSAADSDAKRARKKSTSYKVDVEIKRTSQPDYIETGSVNSRQGPLLPPVSHQKSLDNVNRPKFQQSISVDSGCVLDDPDVEAQIESPSTNVSMSSLVNAFRNYTGSHSTDGPKVGNRKSHLHDLHQQPKDDVSLRRLVTDPRVGHRNNSKHCSPQPYQKPPETRHSLTIDISVNNKEAPRSNRLNGIGNLSNGPKLANNRFVQSNKSTGEDRGLPDVHFQTKNKDTIEKPHVKRPMKPPSRATPPRSTPPRSTPPRSTPPRSTPPRSTPPRSTPPREPPPLPPIKESDAVRTLKNKPTNLKQPKAPENTKNNVDAKSGQSNSVPKGRVNGISQPLAGLKPNAQKQGLSKNHAKNHINSTSSRRTATELPKSETKTQNTANGPQNVGHRNVKNIAHRFENL